MRGRYCCDRRLTATAPARNHAIRRKSKKVMSTVTPEGGVPARGSWASEHLPPSLPLPQFPHRRVARYSGDPGIQATPLVRECRVYRRLRGDMSPGPPSLQFGIVTQRLSARFAARFHHPSSRRAPPAQIGIPAAIIATGRFGEVHQWTRPCHVALGQLHLAQQRLVAPVGSEASKGARFRGFEPTRHAHRLWIGLFTAPVPLIPNYDQYKKPVNSGNLIPNERIHLNSPSAS